MKLKDLRVMDLALFDGAAGADGAGAVGTTGGDGAQTSNQGEKLVPPTRARKGKSGEFQNVIFGKQPSAGADTGDQGGDSGHSDAGDGKKETGVLTTSDALEAKRKAYRDLVNGEYKEQYDQDVQFLLDRRFKDHKALEQQVGEAKPILDLLMQRFDIKDGDLGKLLTAVQDDEAWLEKAAREAGMTKEQFREVERLRLIEKERNEEKAMQAGRERFQRQFQTWVLQAEEAKKTYPSFDLQTESQNPEFVRMLKAGVPVQHAYEVIHMEDIMAGVAKMQAKATEKQVTEGIRARGQRPQENGTSSQSGFIIKDDVSKLTKAERAEAVRRSLAGATITF